MYNTRLLEETDYPQLVEWWKFWRFPAPLQEMLPENGTCGIMLSKDGINICAGFIYFTNSKMCWIEFIVSNPNYKEKDRKEAITQLINSLCELAGSYGFKVAYTNLKNESLINHFTECQFVKGTSNTTEMIKSL